MDEPDVSTADSLTFVGSSTPLNIKDRLQAALVISSLPREISTHPCLQVSSLYAAMHAILVGLRDWLLVREPFVTRCEDNEIHRNAIVNGFLEGGVKIDSGAYVAAGSKVGEGTVVGANAVILENCCIGKGCQIQPGAVIGCSGFGFFDWNGTSMQIPHLAGVELGNNVWVGANSVIAAGVLNPTVIGSDCKLDSHVQIAHNVRLGAGCFLASKSGIAGSTKVGDRLRMGGAASIAGHLRLGNDVTVGACSGVTKNLPDKSMVAGFPAEPLRQWRRQVVRQRMQSDRE